MILRLIIEPLHRHLTTKRKWSKSEARRRVKKAWVKVESLIFNFVRSEFSWKIIANKERSMKSFYQSLSII